jgi:hypothetical protein
MSPFVPKNWLDRPPAVDPFGGESVRDWLIRCGAYAAANPTLVTPLSAAALEDLETRLASYTDAEVAAAKGAVESSQPRRISVAARGIIGDGSDCQPGLQAIADEIKAGPPGIYEVFFADPEPGAFYRCDDEVDWGLPNTSGKRLRLLGQGDTRVLANFAGADKALFRGVNVGARHCPGSIDGFVLGHVSQDVVHPLLLWVDGAGEWTVGRLRTLGANNTAVRLTGCQNLRANNESGIYNYFGGHPWIYKDTTGITFTCAPGSFTVTASASVFSASDVGRWFTLHSATGNFTRYHFVIAAVTDATHATLSIPQGLASSNMPTLTAQKGYFEQARCSMDDDGTTLVADADVFVPEHVGMRLFVRNGALIGSPATTPRLLKATIIAYVGPSTVEVDTPAQLDVSSEPFCTPGIEISGADYDTGSNSGVDLCLPNIQVENGIGVPLLVQDASQFLADHCKVEPITNPTATLQCQSHLWLDNVSGSFTGLMLSGSSHGWFPISVTGQQQIIRFSGTESRLGMWFPLFTLGEIHDSNGGVLLDGLLRLNGNTLPFYIAEDPNAPDDPRFFLTGMVDGDRTVEDPRVFLGTDLFAEVDGTLIPEDLQASIGGAAQRFQHAFLGHFPDVPVRTVVANTTIDSTGKDAILLLDTTSGPLTATLPSAASAGEGRRYTLIRSNTGANVATLMPNGAQTIGGASSYRFTFRSQFLQIASDGTNWRITGQSSQRDRRIAALRASNFAGKRVIRESIPLDQFAPSSTALVSGRLEKHAIWLEGGDVLTGLGAFVGSTGGSVNTHFALSLWDLDDPTVLVRATVDNGAAVISATNPLPLDWLAGDTWTVPVSGLWYIGVQWVGTGTIPTLYSLATATNPTNSVVPPLSGTADTGLTTGTPPNPSAALIAKSGYAYVVAY